MAYKPLENRQLTAVNRPVNWALNRSGYRSELRLTAVNCVPLVVILMILL